MFVVSYSVKYKKEAVTVSNKTKMEPRESGLELLSPSPPVVTYRFYSV